MTADASGARAPKDGAFPPIRRGPLPAAMLPLTLPLSWLYGAAVARRNAQFDAGRGIKRLPIPTISVGNIVAGGSGKSPMARWIARALVELGHRPLIALRGYRAQRGGESDEALEHAARLPDVPVIVGADRHASIAAALARGLDADCVVLDDGFQHRRLARDLDIALVDARRPELDGRLLPAGWLREPASALRRADAVIVTHATAMTADLEEAIRRAHGAAPIASAIHRWAGLEIHRPPDDAAGRSQPPAKVVDVEWLRGRRVVALLGLADPSAVLGAARDAGAVVAPMLGRDHQRYTASTVDRLRQRLAASRAEAVLMTGKDWAKFGMLATAHGDGPAGPLGVPIAVPVLEIEFAAGREGLFERLRSVLRGRP